MMEFSKDNKESPMSTTDYQPVIDFDDPSARLALLEKVGIPEYNRLMTEHMKRSVIKVVNGYGICPVSTRFGRLFAIGGTRVACSSLEQAEDHARSLPKSPTNA